MKKKQLLATLIYEQPKGREGGTGREIIEGRVEKAGGEERNLHQMVRCKREQDKYNWSLSFLKIGIIFLCL